MGWERAMTARRWLQQGWLGLGVAAAGLSLAPTLSAAGTFASLSGSWSGSGNIRLDDGRSEALKCRAYYSPKGEENLGLALRCASSSNKIELRAQLTASGSRVAGHWEERTFNASGTVAGHATGNNIKLAISGGGFSGSMAVTTDGRSQVISVATQGVALKGVNVNLRRD
jgi:hypothetical protein